MKRMCLLGLLSIVLSGCGAVEARTEEPPVQKEARVPMQILRLSGDGMISLPKQFQFQPDPNGDWLEGYGPYKGVTISIKRVLASGKIKDAKRHAKWTAQHNAGTYKEVDLTRYPALEKRYNVYSISENREQRVHMFRKVEGNLMYIVDVTVAHSVSNGKADALSRTIAASYTF